MAAAADAKSTAAAATAAANHRGGGGGMPPGGPAGAAAVSGPGPGVPGIPRGSGMALKSFSGDARRASPGAHERSSRPERSRTSPSPSTVNARMTARGGVKGETEGADDLTKEVGRGGSKIYEASGGAGGEGEGGGSGSGENDSESHSVNKSETAAASGALSKSDESKKQKKKVTKKPPPPTSPSSQEDEKDHTSRGDRQQQQQQRTAGTPTTTAIPTTIDDEPQKEEERLRSRSSSPPPEERTKNVKKTRRDESKGDGSDYDEEDEHVRKSARVTGEPGGPTGARGGSSDGGMLTAGDLSTSSSSRHVYSQQTHTPEAIEALVQEMHAQPRGEMANRAGVVLGDTKPWTDEVFMFTQNPFVVTVTV